MRQPPRQAASPASLDPAGALAPGRWLAVLGIGVGVLMVTLDFSIVNISLPTLVEELATDFATCNGWCWPTCWWSPP